MSLTRAVRTQLALAILFIALGAGNIIFGTYKAREYRRALFQASQEVIPVREGAVEGQALPEALTKGRSADGPSSYLSLIRARYDFYLFVTVGGKWMLALAGFLLLLSLVGMADQEQDEEEPRSKE